MRLLLIEDDAALCEALSLHLQKEGYTVDVCQSGADADYYLSDGAYGAVILDRMLPQVDGLTLLKRFRGAGHTTPVLMLTAMDSINDRTDGLDAGADDYLVKPFAVPELLSRIRALLRRPVALLEPDNLTYLDMVLSTRERRLTRGKREVTLSGRETAVLELLFQNPGKVIPRETLLAGVWGGDEAVEGGNVDNYIYFVRRRLKALEAPAVIKAVHGVGYQLMEENGHG